MDSIAAKPAQGAAHTLAEKLKIGREIKQALDAMVPEEKRMTDAQIAKCLGCSQQYVTRIELLALYKLRMRLREIVTKDELAF